MSKYIFDGKKAMEAINDISTSNDTPKENNILMQSKEPPLGPTPKCIFESQCKRRRIIELKEAIKRFLNSNRVTPIGFLEEYNDLVKELPIED